MSNTREGVLFFVNDSIAFMEARGVPGIPQEYDVGINRGLGLPSAFYHFAFEAGSEATLEEKRQALIANGVQKNRLLSSSHPFFAELL